MSLSARILDDKIPTNVGNVEFRSIRIVRNAADVADGNGNWISKCSVATGCSLRAADNGTGRGVVGPPIASGIRISDCCARIREGTHRRDGACCAGCRARPGHDEPVLKGPRLNKANREPAGYVGNTRSERLPGSPDTPLQVHLTTGTADYTAGTISRDDAVEEHRAT